MGGSGTRVGRGRKTLEVERVPDIFARQHKPVGFRILLVDDDSAVLETTSALLEDEATMLTATSAEKALGLVAEQEVHVVCTDFKMDGMNGLELLRRVHTLDSRTVGILVTGFREQLPRGVAGDPAIFALIYKPYKGDTLRKTIRDAARCAAMARVTEGFRPASQRLSGRGGAEG
jgi:DNA-binding NtrC family response regulator